MANVDLKAADINKLIEVYGKQAALIQRALARNPALEAQVKSELRHHFASLGQLLNEPKECYPPSFPCGDGCCTDADFGPQPAES